MSARAHGSPSVSILGSRVDRVDMDASLERFEELLRDGGRHQIVVLPINSIMAARRSRKFRRIVEDASMVVADGVPLLWASRLLGNPIPGRVAGSDLVLRMSEIAARKTYTFYFLGSRAGIPQKLARVLSRDFPGLAVVGAYAPPFLSRFSNEENIDIIDRVNRAKPDILWVGLGAPKQEIWIHENLNLLDVKVAVGVGAAFEMLSGSTRRAPLWMQKTGLEWFHRFLMEPGRMFDRYFMDAMPFFPLVLLQRLSIRRPKSRDPMS